MRRLWLTAIAVLALPGAAWAVTVDALLFQDPPTQKVVHFDVGLNELQYVFFPHELVLSNGDVVERGAGSTNGSAPNLVSSAIVGSLQILTFSQDPFRPWLTRFGSVIEGPYPGFQIELDFVSLRIEGAVAQSAGQLVGSALLVDDSLGTSASVPVGTTVPITATVALLNGAVFGPGLTDSDFDLTLDGKIDLVPEPSTGVLLGLGVFCLALRSARRP